MFRLLWGGCFLHKVAWWQRQKTIGKISLLYFHHCYCHWQNPCYHCHRHHHDVKIHQSRSPSDVTCKTTKRIHGTKAVQNLCAKMHKSMNVSDLTGKNLNGTNMCPYSHVEWEAFQWDTGHQPLHQYLSKLQNVFVWIVKYICEMRWWWWWCWGYWWWAWPWWW